MTRQEQELAQNIGLVFVRKLPGAILGVALEGEDAGLLRLVLSEGVENCWLYPRLAAAIAAAAHWTPTGESSEPHGWIRHPFSGRRRLYGDQSRESDPVPASDA